jgi:hypothetical protein
MLRLSIQISCKSFKVMTLRLQATNTLRRAASIISQDPTFSASAQAAAERVLRESPDQVAGFEP